MLKVSGIWRMLAVFAVGISFGIFISMKYIAPPSQDIKIGKITIKGRNNTITDAVDISKQDTQDNSVESKRDKRKREREERRAEE